MGKKNNQGQKVLTRHIREAAEVKREANKWLVILIFSVLVGVAAWCLVSFTPINDHSIVGSIVIFGSAVIIVIVIGEIGVRFARYNSEFTKMKNERGVTNELVKEYMRAHKK